MTEIRATKGKTFIIDDEFAYLKQYRWFAVKMGTEYYYAHRRIGSRVYLSLHREVMNAQRGQWVDHINHDTQDCRRSNLRICTPAQNCQNRKIRDDNRIRIKGVRMRPSKFSGPRFPATIFVNGNPLSLGTFDTQEDAAHAYDKAARRYFGEFAKTNEGMRHEA